MKVKIKKCCKKQNISLYRLAQLFDCPQQTIYSWANKRTQPSYENMDKLCILLNCTMSDLFELEK